MPSKLMVDEEVINFSGLVGKLCDEYGHRVKECFLTEDGALKSGLMLIVNGKIFRSKDVLSIDIPDGSIVMVSVILAGG